MFSALRVRNYRLFALGQAVSNSGTWMQRVAQDWLVLTLTGSATSVGVTIALQFLPTLVLGLYSGVIADRYARRTIMLVTQSCMGLTSFALAMLTLTGNVVVWHVYVFALVLGLATVADTPARQAFASELVGPEDLRNAVALNAANFSAARIVGPALAALLITAVGTGWAFLLNALSFLGPIIALALMRTNELHRSETQPRRPGQLREGLQHVRNNPNLLWPIVLVGVLGTFCFNFPVWLAPFTETVFRQGADGYGLLNVLIAVGTLAGALLAAKLTSSRTTLLVYVAALHGALLMATAFAPSFLVLAVIMPAIGLMTQVFNTTANSHIQLTADPAMRGRVMSLYVLVFIGGLPIGGPVTGWITDRIGARGGVFVGGAIAMLAAGAVRLALAQRTTLARSSTMD